MSPPNIYRGYQEPHRYDPIFNAPQMQEVPETDSSDNEEERLMQQRIQRALELKAKEIKPEPEAPKIRKNRKKTAVPVEVEEPPEKEEEPPETENRLSEKENDTPGEDSVASEEEQSESEEDLSESEEEEDGDDSDWSGSSCSSVSSITLHM